MTKLLPITTNIIIPEDIFDRNDIFPLSNIINNRDRTNEFHTLVKIFAEKQSHVRIHREQYASSAIKQRSIFMQNTKRIGENLLQTFFKVERLTLLIKQSSLFNDKSIEIQDLILTIKEDISQLNKQIEQLQQTMNSKSKDLQTHSKSVVFTLQWKVATMSNNLKQILEIRIQNLNEEELRRDKFSKNLTSSSLTISPSINHSSILLRDDTIIDMNSDQTYHSSMYQQLQIMDQSNTYYTSRSEAMQLIEQTIVELGQTVTQLTTIIQQQNESIERTDEDVEERHRELMKHLRTVTSNRWLIVKVFAVLIIFFLLFIVFLT